MQFAHWLLPALTLSIRTLQVCRCTCIENRIIRVVRAEWAVCSYANDANFTRINYKATSAIGEFIAFVALSFLRV